MRFKYNKKKKKNHLVNNLISLFIYFLFIYILSNYIYYNIYILFIYIMCSSININYIYLKQIQINCKKINSI